MEFHACRKCHRELEATEENFYRAGEYFNWICKPCMISYTAGYRRQAQGRPGKHEVACLYCGRVWESARRDVRLCSYGCRYKWRNEKAKADRLARRRAEVPVLCLHCGQGIPPTNRSDAAYCSERCNSAAHNLVRKMAKRGKTNRKGFNRAHIAERDGWRCGICREAVDRRLWYPNPLAPSIDHIIPLARGGDNSLANLQLTHLHCNLSKRADARNEQLRLVG